MSKIALEGQGIVAETLVIPLYYRALETQRPDALIRDEKAVEMVGRIDYDFSRIKILAHDQAGLVLRVREFDRQTRDFLKQHPRAAVVHIGCGLDTRFERVDSGQVEWYDLDLPEVIGLRRQLLGESPRCHAVACSVFDPAWLDAVSASAGCPFLFVAEGVLPYFEEAQVKWLFLLLRDRFPGAELICDAMTPFVVRAHNIELAFSKMKARLRWGLKHGRDVEKWGAGIRLLSEWFYFDTPEPRMESSRWMRRFAPLGKAVGIYHYRLG